MTSLSIRSSNAIKSSPGKGSGEENTGNIVTDCEYKSGSVSVLRFLSKEHIKQMAASIRSPELVLLFILSLCVFFGLLSLRVFDDNKLTSWHWLFANADLLIVSLFLVTGLLAGLLFINITVSRNQAVTFLTLSSTFLSVVHWGSPEVILDAGRYFSQAKSLEIYGISYFLEQWGHGIMAWTDLPLLPLIYGLIFKIFGESRLGIQIINTAFFCGTVYLTYCLGKLIWNHRVGIYSALMLLAIPYLQSQVPLMMVDVPAMFFLTLAVFLFVRAVSLGGILNTTLAATGILLAIFSKYTNWLMLSVLPVVGYIYFTNSDLPDEKEEIIKRSRNVVTLFILLAIIPITWAYDVILMQIGLLKNYQLGILDGWTESHISTFIYQMHPFIAIASLFSLYMAFKHRDRKILIAAWMLILVFAIDIERIRYVMIVFPMLALMAGYALAQINKAEFRRYLALSILVTASTVSVFGHASFLREHSAINMQAAANYMDNLDYPFVEVIALDQQQSNVNPIISLPLFDMYTRKNVINNNSVVKGDYGLTDEQRISTLRFTWEYEVPEYYRNEKQRKHDIIAVISSDHNQVLPAEVKEKLSGYYRDKRFNKDEGIFRYKTIVDIYLPVGSGR